MNLPPDEPAGTIADSAEIWLTVSEAVAHCSLLGLSRTPKTVRRWAHRSAQYPESGDLIVRSQDLETGFRWTIRKDSLERKVAQELEFEARKTTGPEHPGPTMSGHVSSESDPHFATETCEDTRAPGLPGSNNSAQGRDLHAVNEELRDRIRDLKSQVEFYEEEFRDRRQTTKALTDVIAAFRLNAETQASQSRGRHSSSADVTSENTENTFRAFDAQKEHDASDTEAETRKLNVISQSSNPVENNLTRDDVVQ